MGKFKLGDKEYPISVPKGKNGRKATNFILAHMGEQLDMAGLVALMEMPEFEKHLPVLLGISQDVLDSEGTTMEIINAMTAVLNEMFTAIASPEVDAALKNSEGGQKEDQQTP